MAKHRLTRAHNGQDAGQEIEVPAEQLQYFKNVGLIKEEKEKVQTKEEKLPYHNKANKGKGK